MDLPQYLIDQVRSGQVVLFAGAGASKGATLPDGREPPSGQELADAIALKFLGSDHAGLPLQVITELAINESSLAEVQDFVASTLRGLQPSRFHLTLPTFRWRGIATTNFDTVIETAYEFQTDRAQNLVPFLSNEDRIDEKVRSVDAVVLLKLHGCITRTHDPDLPLILTFDQYVTHKTGRERLFNTLIEWAYENPVVFVGYNMRDSDIREILHVLSELKENRPRHYLVVPEVREVERRYWEMRRVTVLEGTFETFLRALESSIPMHTRRLAAVAKTVHPVESRLATADVSLTDTARAFLDYDVDYVPGPLPGASVTPQAFYRGYNPGWAAIEQGLDVRRELVETILLDVLLADEGERPAPTEFCVIKAEAGAGKSVCLRRVAWEAAKDYEKLCLFLRPYGRLSYEPVAELALLTKERVFLFVDDAADRVVEIEDLLTKARRDSLRLTVLSAERVNEWNMTCERIKDYVTSMYTLPYLNEREIGDLVDLLTKHRSLGHLNGMPREAQVRAFKERAGRQLLVALHEATQGKPFEEILVDEYNEIRPQRAQNIYLSICILNRLGVPVRAGIISRVYGVPFEAFRTQFFEPLEHVVYTGYDPVTKDYHYTARHPEIAQIVFERILSSPADRFDHYIRLLAALNAAYTTDRQALRQLVRGRTLLELFPDHSAVVEIFRVACSVAGNDPYLYHQMGIYEMNRPNGNLRKAQEYLSKAHEMSPSDKTIVHSLAELARRRAEASETPGERERWRKEAERLVATLLASRHGAYGYHTLIRVALDRLREALSADSVTDREIDTLIQDTERYLTRALQAFPDDEFLLASEAELARILKDDERAFMALKKAFDANRRSPFIASRLAKAYVDRGGLEEAVHVLSSAVEANRGEKRLHYELAMLLLRWSPDDVDSVLYHLRRAFSPGDGNYVAQFWYATLLFITGERDKVKEAKDIFRSLRRSPMGLDVRNRVRHVLREGSAPKRFTGTIVGLESSYGFIERHVHGDRLFVHSANVDNQVWRELRVADSVGFALGFTFGGPTCIEVQKISTAT
ncbi:MAG: SIR2 family protein [Bacillota bacterium]